MLSTERRAETQRYTNDLHDALISKSGVSFWKRWRSKFEKKNKSSELIDGLADDAQIAEAFAKHFRKTCTSVNEGQSNCLHSMFRDGRQYYVTSTSLMLNWLRLFSQMKRGKAAGLDELTIEHLVYSHPVLVATLSKFFNLIVSAAYIPRYIL